jgi:hypothetical protein
MMHDLGRTIHNLGMVGVSIFAVFTTLNVVILVRNSIKRLTRLSLDQEQHARSYRQDRQEVAAVGEAETEKRCRQEAKQDQPDVQQQHPEVLGHFHDYAPRFTPAIHPHVRRGRMKELQHHCGQDILAALHRETKFREETSMSSKKQLRPCPNEGGVIPLVAELRNWPSPPVRCSLSY